MTSVQYAALAALGELAKGDPEGVWGPKEIADAMRGCNPPYLASPSLVCVALKGLVESDEVERVSLGKKRGVYRPVRKE